MRRSLWIVGAAIVLVAALVACSANPEGEPLVDAARREQDVGAQEMLRQALTTANAYYTGGETYGTA